MQGFLLIYLESAAPKRFPAASRAPRPPAAAPGIRGDPRGIPGESPRDPREFPGGPGGSPGTPRNLFMILKDFNVFSMDKNNIGLKRVAVGAMGLLQNGLELNFEADAMP